MTEKTDIEALRDKLELALKDLTERLTDCHRLNFCMDELSAFTAFSSTVIDQLEEERQQREAAEAELAAVRGQKGQIAFRYRWVADEEHEASRWMYEDRPEEFDSIMKLEGAEWEEFRITPASKLTIKEAVSAYISKSAGIVVKDGE
ncbi:hypothetical protein V2154_15875 [Ewingella sp. CoE-038-23]|uniref:hypothetical protein n=1 Tax=Ewingella docleensis TaxID=3118588 RepID=UPI0033657D68